jgi:hypothetical protein
VERESASSADEQQIESQSTTLRSRHKRAHIAKRYGDKQANKDRGMHHPPDATGESQLSASSSRKYGCNLRRRSTYQCRRLELLYFA